MTIARMFKVFAFVCGAAAILLGLLVEKFEINKLVGWAFAIAATSAAKSSFRFSMPSPTTNIVNAFTVAPFCLSAARSFFGAF